MNIIKVFNIVGANAISIQSGTNLYDKIHADIFSGQEVCLDFSEVELFASPFFNASIGRLLKDVELTDLLKRLKINNISQVGRQLLNHVVANALTFYGK